MTTLVTQAPSTSLNDVLGQLHAAFTAARSAIDADEQIIFVVRGADLLGQGSVEDAAVATGLLGLMRALLFEGAAKGWRATTVAVDDPDHPGAEVIRIASETGALNGQVLNLSSGRLGRMIP